MDYRPRFYQPFSLEEAVHMDVSILTEEITRLQNSLNHLKQTQTELLEVVQSDPDPELRDAVKENEVVIGSQEERIGILKMALTEKGIFVSSHYDLPPSNTVQTTRINANASNYAQAPSSNGGQAQPVPSQGQQEDDGVYL